jgi:hypothetical protein
VLEDAFSSRRQRSFPLQRESALFAVIVARDVARVVSWLTSEWSRRAR